MEKLSGIERVELKEQVAQISKKYSEQTMGLLNSYSDEIREVLDPLTRYSYKYVADGSFGTRLKEHLEIEGNKPSDFFRAELQNMPGWIPEQYLEDFYCSVDAANKWQICWNAERHTIRAKNYLMHTNHILILLARYHELGIYGTDIVSAFRGKMPDAKVAYFRRGYSHIQFWVQAELDRGNTELEEVLKEILLGEEDPSWISYSLFRGIFRSEDQKMYEVAGELLMRAGLQEGVRQAICESMDCGTVPAFQHIFQKILENNLLRFSSVMRSIITYTGIFFGEEQQVERITKKQMELIDLYLKDEKAREQALQGEDAMEIYLALWSYGFYELDEAIERMEGLILNGTRHQCLVACYYLKRLDLNTIYVHEIMKLVLRNRRKELDVIAAAMDGFMPRCGNRMYWLAYKKGEHWHSMDKLRMVRQYAELETYFKDAKECGEFYDLLMEMLPAVSKKQLVYEKSAFTWNTAVLNRNSLLKCLAYCASALHDEDKIAEAAGHLPDMEAGDRYFVLAFLLTEPQNEKQKELLVAAMADREQNTREVARTLLKKEKLSDKNYRQLEDMLRYKNADIRSSVLSVIYQQEDGKVLQSIKHLLSDGKEEKRTAGLDLILQLGKNKTRTEAYQKSLALIAKIKAPTTKEEILIQELTGGGNPVPKAENGYGLYDVQAEYMPEFDLEYREECREIFEKRFPKELREHGLFGGALAEMERPYRKEGGNRYAGILRKMDAIFEEHKLLEYENDEGEVMTIGQAVHWGDWHGKNMPLKELLFEFYEKEIKDYTTCFLLKLYMEQTEQKDRRYPEYCQKYEKLLFGRLFSEKLLLVWKKQIQCALGCLLEYCDREKEQAKKLEVAVAVVDRFLQTGEKAKEDEKNLFERTPFYEVIWSLKTRTEGNVFDKVFPYYHAIYDHCGFQLEPPFEFYIVAYKRRLISKDYLYKRAFENNLSANIQNLSYIADYYLEQDSDEEALDGKKTWRDWKQREAVERLLGHNVEDAWSKEDIELLSCATELYRNISKVMLETELRRGDTETEFSGCIRELKQVYGVEYFVRILAALGRDTLERSCCWYLSEVSKKSSLSHLLRVCVPEKTDTVEKLKKLLQKTDIKEKRLIEAAMYSPEWIPLIAEYLEWDGFASGCYYFMAHMSEYSDGRRIAMIARYSPLEVSELLNGAFDIAWFWEVYGRLGEKRFKALYDAAKYISDGAKHVRARKYADAARGIYDAEETFAEICAKRNKDLLMAYSLIPLKDEKEIHTRYLNLMRFKKESRQFGTSRRESEANAVAMAMQNLSINAGYEDVTRLVLRMECVSHEERKQYFEPKQIEEIQVCLHVDEDGKCEILCEKAGKKLKSVPAKYKKNEYVAALIGQKKQMTEQYRRTRAMFEDSMETQTEYKFDELKNLLGNPVTEKIISKLVLKSGKGMGFLQPEGLFSIENGGALLPFSGEETVTIAHPFHLYEAGCWREYQKYIFEQQMRQPFKQVYRELYIKTEEERGMKYSLRYAGNQIYPAKTLGCLSSRHWIADVHEGLQKVYHKAGIIVRIYAVADWFSPADIEAPTLEWVEFFDRKSGEQLEISRIPDIIFSEAMRDVDLAVSVAHAGGTDPETSHSTIEMRRAIAEFTMPLFKLDNVTFLKNHAVITGRRADYTVHLGSGVVHQQAGPMINVLPVHSQRRGRLFLPFVDEDPKTSEVLTKILFFAEDHKIKDPSILRQIE